MKIKSLLFVLFPLFVFSQNAKKDAKNFRKEINKQYGDPDKSPLKEEDRKGFKALEFFDFNEALAFEAQIEWLKVDSVFEMKTTTARIAKYKRAAKLTFQVNGEQHQLTLFQSVKATANPEYVDHFFLPFKDYTNGNESYGGGRYIDLEIKEGATSGFINFNKAYNPYCAYNDRYSCPIVPQENYLSTEIKAGVKAPAKH